jgi:protein SDA1
MLFGMVERGMDAEVTGDKGKLRVNPGPTSDKAAHNGEDAMWAIILTKELWRKGIWYASTYHPTSATYVD